MQDLNVKMRALEFKCQNSGIDKLKKSPLEICLLLILEKIAKNQTKSFQQKIVKNNIKIIRFIER